MLHRSIRLAAVRGTRNGGDSPTTHCRPLLRVLAQTGGFLLRN
jgi:hypothetical protein